MVCVGIEQALADEIVRRDDVREGVVAVDMACAARLTSLRRLRAFADQTHGRTRRAVAAVLGLAEESSLPPPESRIRLVWLLDARLPRPLCNPIVYTTSGEHSIVPT